MVIINKIKVSMISLLLRNCKRLNVLIEIEIITI